MLLEVVQEHDLSSVPAADVFPGNAAGLGQLVVEDDATRIHAGGWELARRSWGERLTAARRLPQDLAKRAARQCA